jgi:hypothetical protein
MERAVDKRVVHGMAELLLISLLHRASGDDLTGLGLLQERGEQFLFFFCGEMGMVTPAPRAIS